MTLRKLIMSAVLCLCLCLLYTTVPVSMRADAANDLPVTISTTGKTYMYTKSGTNFTELQYGTASSGATAGTITSASVDNGGVKFTIDTKSNKLFKLYYKEIPVTINVPANTEFSVEFSYDFDGQHIRSNKKATANVSAMIVYQGTESASNKIKFYPISEASASAYTTINGTEADKVFGTGVTYSGGATSSTTVNMYSVSGETYTAKFTNNTSSAANIARYFGYWVACDYGSSYANRAITNFTLTPKAISYTVKFDADGGTVDTKSKAVSVGSTYGELPVPKLERRAFNGWYTERNGGGREITSTTTVEATDGSTLYPLWTDGPNIGWYTEETIEYGQPGSAGFGGISVDRNNYRYLFEWYQCDDKNRTNERKVAERIYDGDRVDSLYKTPSDLPLGTYYYYVVDTITEISTGKSISVTGPVTTVTVVPGVPKISDFPTASIDMKNSKRLGDHTLIGGGAVNKYTNVSVPGTFSWENVDTEITKTGYQNFYIIFTPSDVRYTTTRSRINVYVGCSHDYIDDTVTKAATCTTTGSKKQKCTVCGATKTVSIPATGHDYENGTWCTDETQHWKQCANCDSTDNPANHTFGEWSGGKRNCTECDYEQVKIMTVSFNTTYGEVATKTKTVKYGVAYGKLPVPTYNDSWVFGGWYTEYNGEGVEVTETTTVTATDDHVLYALWVHKANPSGWGEDKTIEYGQQCANPGISSVVIDPEYKYKFMWYKCDDKDRTNAEKVGECDNGVATSGSYKTPNDLSVGEHYYYVVATTTHLTSGKTTTQSGTVVTITVKPSEPRPEQAPDSINIDLGKDSNCLSDYNVPDCTMKNKYSGVTVLGKFSWVAPDTIFEPTTEPDTVYVYARFTPDDQDNYKSVDIQVSVNVSHTHEFTIDGDVIKTPTCTATGSMKKKCSVCGLETTVDIPAAGHDYKNGKWQSNEAQHWKQCANCDSTDTPEDHTFGEWSGGKRTCEVCGYEDVQLVTVTITWSELAFTYMDGLWNPETHDYSMGEWTLDRTDGDKITVENQGSDDVSLSFVYTQVDNAIEGSFADDNGVDIESPVALPSGNTRYAWLHLSGRPNRDMNAETVGTVTVRLGGNE